MRRPVPRTPTRATRAHSGERGVIGLPPVSPAIAATPYMGWNTYYGVGGRFDERTIVSVADSLIERGLARAGYRIVWLDFGWASGRRGGGGELVADRHQWPGGLRRLTAWLHARGLRAGIYTDAGATGCHGQGVGSLGHYRQDADTFARWGFDAVKVDFCGAGQERLDPRPLYDRFAEALATNSSHRPMLLNVCNFWVPGQIDGTRPSLGNSSYANALWAPQIAESWRTDTDIGATGHITFPDVLRNLGHDAAGRGRAAGPGHWSDPDYLGPQLGMTGAEARAQLTMWAIVSAPLILGSDPRTLSAQTVRMLSNPAVIAVDQDRLGIRGAPIPRGGSGQVWVKPLLHGQRAVALLNRGATPIQISTSATAIRTAPSPRYRVENLWSGATHTTRGQISARVAPHSAMLYRVTAAGAVGIAGASGDPGWARPRSAEPNPRGASTPSGHGIDIQAVYDANGNPSLVANFTADGALAKPRWSRCSPSHLNVCAPASATQFLTAGATPAGTVFEATANYEGRTYVARTAPWQGAVHAVLSPRLDGQPRFGAIVTPHRASWTGGWRAVPSYKPTSGNNSGGRGPDFDFLSVEACRTPEASHCVNLSAPARNGGFSTRPPVVGESFTGWYLFAIDQRFAHDTAFAEPGYGSPAAVPPVKLGATVARSAPLGPVIGPPAPSVSILHNAILSHGRALVARVRCSVRCRASAQVDDNHTSSDAQVTLTGSRLLGVARRHLRRGSLNVQVYVDSGPPVRGRTRLR